MVYLLASAGKTDHDPFRAPRLSSHFALFFFFPPRFRCLLRGKEGGGYNAVFTDPAGRSGSAALVLMKNRSRLPGKIKTDKEQIKEAVLYQKFTQ